MRKAAGFGIGMGTVAVVAAVSAGVAMASTAAPRQAGVQAAAVTTANHHITRAQAAAIARAKVPHGKVIEIESEERHDRAVWQVQLATPRGRVVVDVDKKTGAAVIVRRDGRGDGDQHGRDERGRDDHGRGERGDRRDHGDRHDHRDRHDHDGDHRGQGR